MKQVLALLAAFTLTVNCAFAQEANLTDQLKKLELELQQNTKQAVSVTIDVKDKVIEIRTMDLRRATDSAFEWGARHPKRQVTVHVPALPKHQSARELKLSKGQTLLEGFSVAEKTLINEMKQANIEVALNLDTRLGQMEKYLGLETNLKLTRIERSYRICWAEQLSRQRRPVEIIFE